MRQNTDLRKITEVPVERLSCSIAAVDNPHACTQLLQPFADPADVCKGWRDNMSCMS